MRRTLAVYVYLLASLTAVEIRAAGEKLYGVHWWDYANPSVGSGPQGGWSVETIVTESDPWWRAPFFVPLYQQLSGTQQAAIVTRVDYNWGQTVPGPSSSSAQNWANKIVSEVISPLGNYAYRWVIGNEPNINGEGNGWAGNQITPAGYAQIYHTVRQTIKAQRPNDEVLFAPVSPGGVIPGVRWKEGNQWLAEAIDATLALPGGAIDGFAIHGYGNPFTNAAQAVTDFHNTYVSQLAVIDARPLRHVPVYITEWNRATSTSGNLAANEQVSADFLQMSLLDVDAWNRTPGNHNIRSLAWFIHNKDYGSAWNQYSIEWWQSQGNPVGHAGDLWTALINSSGLQAGLVGTRPLADYNIDGAVTASDYTSWSSNFGRTNWIYADGNRDGVVNAADYVIWRKSTAAGQGAGLLSVPETAAIAYLLMGGAAISISWRAQRWRANAAWAAMLGTILISGCSNRPDRVDVADVDPATAASQAVEIYDANDDGKLSDDELRQAPGILKWKSLYDADSDGMVTEAEIAARIAKTQADKIGFRSMSAVVKLNGQPLPNVSVTIKPEAYLGDAIKEASGVTNAFGSAKLAVAPDDLPPVMKERGIRMAGVYPGTYKIVLSHPQRKLPATGKNGAPLGDEIAGDTADSSIQIEL